MKKNKRKTKKEIIISKILTIIKEHGSFDIDDVKDETICLNVMGDLTAEASVFSKDDVEVKVYRPSGISGDAITSYYVNYEDLTVDQLEEILRVSEEHALDCEKAWERSQN